MSGIVVLLARPLKLGARGADVLAVKRALSRAGYGTWLGVKFTPLLGPLTVILLTRFQRANGLMADGEYGPNTHKKLAPHFDAYSAKLMNDAFHRLQDTPAKRAISAALEMYNYYRLTGRFAYTQASSRWSVIARKLRPPRFGEQTIYGDCSSSVTAQDWLAGNPDPNDLSFTAGYTGTLSVHGQRVKVAVLGALGFYGFAWPYKHVVRCIGFRPDGTAVCWSFGSNPPKIIASNYRGDFSHWRTYS